MLVSTIEFEVTTMLPVVPEVPETRLRRDPLASVNTLAVIPTEDELMAAASSVRFLSAGPRVIVLAVPLPT